MSTFTTHSDPAKDVYASIQVATPVMDNTSIVYISAEILVGLLSVVGNCVVVGAIWKNRRLHTITNVFVGNLAIADIVVGLLAAPCAALAYAGLPRNFYGCVFINSVILIVTNISILMLLGVALERFLAIKEPFLYQRTLTVRRAIYINLFIWLIGFLLGMVPMYGWNKGVRELEQCQFTSVITYEYMVYFQFFGLVLLPLFLMMCIYIYILIIVRRHMRQTNALRNMFQQERRVQEGFSKDVKAAKMLAVVILFFGIFWLPINIMNCFALFCPECYYPYELLLAAIVMSHANSCINPFLYAASNSRIKRAIKDMFGIKSSPEDNSTDMNYPRHTNNVSQACVPTPNQPSDRSELQDDNRVLPFTISRDKFLHSGRRMSVAITPLDDSLEMPGPTTEAEEEGGARNLADGTLSTNLAYDSKTLSLQSLPPPASHLSLPPSASHLSLPPSASHLSLPETNTNSANLLSPESIFTVKISNSEFQNNKSNGHIGDGKNLRKNEKNHAAFNPGALRNEIYDFLEDPVPSPDHLTLNDTHEDRQWCWPSNGVVANSIHEDTSSVDTLIELEGNNAKSILNPQDSGCQFTEVYVIPDTTKTSIENPEEVTEFKTNTNGYIHMGHFDSNVKKRSHNFISTLDDSGVLTSERTEQTKL